jgi:hypothetical protein
VKITIYADTLADAARALAAVRQESAIRPAGPGHRKRNGSLWSGADDWHVLVWGTPDHWRADCRRQQEEAATNA